MVDKFSKFASTAITKNQTAATTVKAARSKVIQTFGDRCQTKVQNFESQLAHEVREFYCIR